MEKRVQQPSESGEETIAPENVRGWWSTFSAACVILAVPLLLTGWFKAAFVVAAVGCVAWFLNVRSQLKRNDDTSSDGDDDYDDEDDEGDDGGSDSDGGGGDGGGDSD
jgi:hypothetical protein